MQIEINGEIGFADTLTYEKEMPNSATTYNKLRDIIDSMPDKIKRVCVNIRSTGGSVQDALLIHSALASIPEPISVETHCYGFVASAATIIAQAASKSQRYVASSALYMIHNASTQFDGNAADAESIAAMLTKTDTQIAQIYAQRANRPTQQFINIMSRDNGRGEWLTPDEAVEAGLVDVIESCSPLRNFVHEMKIVFNSLINQIPKLSKNAIDQQNEQVQKVYNPLQVEPSKTLPKEDPQISNDSVNLSSNQSAYGRDAEIFKIE